MAANAERQSCCFLALPDELRLNIINNLDRKRDLYSLSLASKAFEDIAMARLYATVDVEVPQDISIYRKTGSYPLFRPHVVQAIRHISVRDRPIDVRGPGYNRRRKSDAGCIDCQIRDIVEHIPQGQLASFSSSITPSTLHTLAARHASSLRTLQAYQFESSDISCELPSRLQALECRSVDEGKEFAKLVQANRHSLQRLRFGQEKTLAEKYRQTRIGFSEQILQPIGPFYDVVRLQGLPNLRELHLCGIDLRSLTPNTVEQAMPFCKLTRLSLESCSGSATFLELLAGVFFEAQRSTDAARGSFIVPQLSEFLFRCEEPTNTLKETLVRFLASFNGLKTLSLLFENAALLEDVSTFIAEHGPTLKTLVLESRIQPRESLSLDTSRPFGVGGFSDELWEQSINDICHLCPDLVELGTGFPWGDETVRLRKSGLPTLKHLKTVHIRNFPESRVLSQIGDYTIKEYATKFIEWIFPPSKGGPRPGLEALAIGPTLYESRWRSNGARRQLPEFLRTHYFCLDFGKTRFGRWSPMITSVSEKCMEEVRGEKPLGRVFEQVWLR